MRRRDYISFFDTSRRGGDYSFGRQRRGVSPRLVAILLVVGLIGATVWWFAGREVPDGSAASGRILGETTVPAVLLPESAGDTQAAGVPENLECPEPPEAEAGILAEWPLFQGGLARTGCTARPVITDPEIRWTADVGIQAWLNNPVISNGVVYVGSAGVAQFERDRRDGVYAFDMSSGDRIWLFGTELDVNGVAYWDEVVVATGDEGRVWGIDAANGDGLWTEDTGSSAFGNPLMIDGMAVVGDANGFVTALDAHTGNRLWQVQADGAVRGGASSDGRVIFAAGENGEVVAMTLDGSAIWRHTVEERGENGSVRIFGAPTITDDLVIVTLVRSDLFAEPAVAALDKSDGSLQWLATDRAGVKPEWGNVRSSPAVAGEVLVFAEPYSAGIVAIGLEDGLTRWAVDAGAFCYPQWSSPVITSGQVVVPRFDGGIYGIDLVERELVWSVYLGDSAANGSFPDGFEEPGFCDWQPTSGVSVLSTPAVSDDGVIVVGTLEGVLYAIGDESWE